jgi:membrane associated rhomboid family serine protease
MLRPKPWQQNFSFGGRVPWAVGLLMALTAGFSLLTAFGNRHAAPLADWVSLRPAEVWHGQVWRLATWPFIEGSPFGLLFACLGLYWFGPPLAQRWGSPRFLAVILGAMLASGCGTCLVALADPAVHEAAYLGSWAMITALVVTWGLTFPENVVRIYFVLPVRGFWFAWGSIAVTVVFAVYSGWAGLLPELGAEAAVLAWLYQRVLLARWARVRADLDTRRRAATRASESKRRGGVVVDLRTGEPPSKRDDTN